MTVFTYNSDARIAAAAGALRARRGAARIHILPIPTKDTEGLAAALLPALRAEDAVFAYAVPPSLKEKLEARGARLFDTEEDEIFIEENATLTAEATLGLMLGLPLSPRDLSVGIIGYGRIGRALCRMLLFLGARVRIFTAREALREALGSEGIESRPIGYAEGEALDLGGLDLLIQTAPARIITRENAPPCPLWNLAAAGYIGEGVAVRQLSALPARIPYESGGKALMRAVLRKLENDSKNERIPL